MPWHPQLEFTLHEYDFHHLLLLRDPRDLVVSFVHFVQKDPRHEYHEFFKGLADEQERLIATITGFAAGSRSARPSIADVYRGFLAWQGRADVLTVRYESLIGAQGGSSEQSRISEVDRIAEFVNRRLSEAERAKVLGGMYSSKSMTFRAGRRGDWRASFTQRAIAAFKEAAPDLLGEAGYEAGSDW
jgi:hypothetical protein